MYIIADDLLWSLAGGIMFSSVSQSLPTLRVATSLHPDLGFRVSGVKGNRKEKKK